MNIHWKMYNVLDRHPLYFKFLYYSRKLASSGNWALKYMIRSVMNRAPMKQNITITMAYKYTSKLENRMNTIHGEYVKSTL